jgi:hypothetical protein
MADKSIASEAALTGTSVPFSLKKACEAAPPPRNRNASVRLAAILLTLKPESAEPIRDSDAKLVFPRI